jgi:hypothetical protein
VLDIRLSYPLALVGCHDGVLDLANVPEEMRTNGLLNNVTVACFSGFAGLTWL